MRLVIHLGMPKALSTTLQRGFFDIHEGINFLGVGVKTNIGYATKDIEYIQENLVKYASERHFNNEKEEFKTNIKSFLSEKSLNVLSGEYMSFRFCPTQNDTTIKLKRIKEIYGQYLPRIIFIKRQIPSFLISIYKEYVRLGYRRSYNEFLIWLWNFRDRNFFEDLNYDNVILQLRELFGFDSVRVYDFEYLVEDLDEFLSKEFCSYLGVDPIPVKNTNFNPSSSDNEIAYILEQNKMIPRNMGESGFYSFENHRNKEWFSRSGAIMDEYNLYEGVYLKRYVLGKSKTISYSSEDLFALNDYGLKAYSNIIQTLKSG